MIFLLRVFIKSCLLWVLYSGTVIAHSQPQVLVVHNDFVATGKIDVLRTFAAAAGVELDHLAIDEVTSADLQRLETADWLILDTPRHSDRLRVKDFLSGFDLGDKKQLLVGGGAPAWEQLTAPLAEHLIGLYAAGGKDNFQNFFALLARAQVSDLSLADLPPVRPFPASGFYHVASDELFSDLASYLAWHNEYLKGPGNHFKKAVVAPKGRVAFLISGSVVADLVSDIVDEIILAAEFKDLQPIVFWSSDGLSKGALQRLFDGFELDALVNLTHLQNGHELVADFSALDIPVIQSLRFREGEIDQWSKATSGVSASVAATFLALPETWGLSDPIVLSGRAKGRDELMPKQLDALINKLVKLINLRKTPNQEKRLALLFWNYPPGEKNIGASNLNVPSSILSIQEALQAAGYEAGERLSEEALIDELQGLLQVIYRPELVDRLIAEEPPSDAMGTTDDLEKTRYALLPLRDYLHWLQQLSPKRRAELMRQGRPERHWAVREVAGESYFVLPRLVLGNLLLMPQMPRSGNPNLHYHDLEQAPDHVYMAAYLYLAKQYAADALIHLGTHGTQEWLLGKDRGLAVEDYPWLAVSDLPVFYPYIQDNIAEAIQAKRRGRAVVISHQTPAFAPSGLYEHLRDMHELVHDLAQLDEGMVRQQSLKQLLDLLEEHHFLEDLAWRRSDAEEDSSNFLHVLHDYLHELAQTAMPLGLHTFGQAAAENARVTTLMQQLGEPFYDALALDEEQRMISDVDQLTAHPAYLKVQSWLNGAQENSVELRPFYQDALSFNHVLQHPGEHESLLRALAGGYVLPGSGGDPVRQPGQQSGRNIYAFEATKIPSKQAYEAGDLAFQQLLAAFKEQHQGAFPQKLAFSLWSSEAIRHLGVTEAQILHALGLRPVWAASGRVERLAIIPLEELGRPRIDVVVQVTGVYRDQFDHFMSLLNAAIAELAQLEEEGPRNPIAINSKAIAKRLQVADTRSLTEGEAMAQAALRIFSNEAGYYGTGVPHLSLESTTWEDEAVLAQQFINSQSSAYQGGTALEKLGPKSGKDLFRAQLAGAEAVIMSRSSNLQGVLSTDHAFEFMGGLSAAIELIDGSAPQLLVSDLRSQTPKTASLAQFLSKELRSHYLNPEWIKAMQQEGYSGTLSMLNITNNLFGWQVMNSSTVRDDQWQAMFDTYVQDHYELGLNDWFEKHNPNAQAQILERMAEAIRKGHWSASAETREAMAERWQQLNERHEISDIAPLSQAFLQQMAEGFDPSGAVAADLTEPTSAPMPEQAADDAVAQTETETSTRVQGRVLAEVTAPEAQDTKPYWLLFLLFWLVLGALWQYRQGSRA